MEFESLPSESTTTPPPNLPVDESQKNTKKEGIVIPKDPYLAEDFQEIFKILPGDLEERVYQPKQLEVVDLQKFLPFVVAEISKLESTWKNCLGLTVSTLNTNIPQLLHKCRKSPSRSITPSVQKKPSKQKKFPEKLPKTGREVVEYLVRSSRAKQIEIWYLNFVPSKRYDPYNLKVASKCTAKSDHVVISVFGVLHVRPNGLSEITPLVRWYMESNFFSCVQNINIFKNYYIIKAFRRWKVNHKYKQYAKIFRKVKERTLMALPSFPNTVLAISTLLNQVDSMKLLPNFRDGSVNSRSISYLMLEQLEIGSKYFSRLFAYSQEIVDKCYKGSKDYIDYCQAQLEAQQYNNAKESMSTARKRKELQRENLRCAKHNLKRLETFVNLINHLIFSHLVYTLCQHLNGFIQTNLLQNNNGCFYTFVDISSDATLLLSPPDDSIYLAILNSLKGVLNNIEYYYIKKLQLDDIPVDESQVIKQDSGISSPGAGKVDLNKDERRFNFADMVLKHELVASSLSQLEEALLVATEEADNVLKSYTWIYEIIQFCISWNSGEVEAWKSLTPSLLEKQILQINAWSKEIKSISPNFISSNGVLFIDCSTIASSLLPQLDEILEQMISETASDNIRDLEFLSKDLNEKIQVLSEVPADIHSFAKYFVYVNDLDVGLNDLQTKVDHMKGVLDVIKHCCRQLTAKEEQNADKMMKLWEDFMFSLQTAKEYISAQSPALIRNMNEEIKEMQRKLLTIVEEATSGLFVDSTQEPTFALKEMKKLYSSFDKTLENLKMYGECKALITGEQVDLTEVYTAQKAINDRYEVWRYLELSLQTINEWKHTLFGKLNVKKVQGKVQEWLIAADQLKKSIPERDGVMKKWIQLMRGFSDNVKVLKELSNPALKPRHWKEIFVVLGHVYEDKSYRVSEIISMPIIDNVYKISQICMAASAECALQNCLNGLIKHWEKRNFKFAKKLQEMDVEKGSKESGSTEKEVEWLNGSKKLTTVGYTLTAIDELVCELEDNLVTLQSMLGSPHVAEVRELAGSWNAKLQEVKEILDLWMVTQQEWLYLGNVFSKPSMQQLHPVEFHIFIETNQLFKELIDSIMADSTVLNILNKRTEHQWSGSNHGYLKQILQQVTQKQSVVIKQMEEYLSNIQSTFPRLYYLSNDEMLNLLAITRNPPAIVPFVKKCFPSIVDLKFGMPKTENVLSSLDVTLNVHRLEAVSFVGHLDENVTFHQSLPLNTSIERWLKLIETHMKEAVCIDLAACAHEAFKCSYSLCEIEFLKELSGRFTFQSILLYMDCYQSNLCREVVLQEQTFSEIQRLQKRDISILTNFLQDSHSSGHSIEKRFLMLVQVLLMKVIHYKEKLSTLKNCEKLSINSFEWLRLVKFEIYTQDRELSFRENVSLKCLDASFQFGYEYYGPMKSLVYTPLSDRCFMTSFLALRDHRVACLTGDEQSGKSETSYEMAKLLGRHYVALNCSDITPLSVISTFLHGALSTGSILCMENTHLLKCNKLSVVGQIFNDLRHALNSIVPSPTDAVSDTMLYQSEFEMASSPTSTEQEDRSFIALSYSARRLVSEKKYLAPLLGNITFGGSAVDVSSLYGCVVTTNTSFNQWKSIPDNLKESLRPVAFTNIDETFIFKIWFLIHGFQKHETLALKLKFLVDNHRDKGYFSLQKLYHLISQTGTTAQSRKAEFADREIAEFSTSLTTMIKPSLARQTFLNMSKEISNIFMLTNEGKNVNSFTDTLLLESVREQVNADNLSPKSEFISKVLELHQVLSCNQSVILVGGVASGKTTCYKTLARSLCQFYSPWSQRVDILTKSEDNDFARVNMKILYPNVLLADQLYGYFDCAKNSPVDGLLTKILSSVAFLENVASRHSESTITRDHSLNQIQQWFVLDGFLDESWVTQFYSLLDYSKQYVLGSGKRIRLLDNMKVLFETDQLASVSPSLLSRCAVLHFQDGEVVTWKCVYSSWRIGAYNKYCVSQRSLNCIEQVLQHTMEPIVNHMHSECQSAFNDDVDHHDEEMKRSRSDTVVECHYVLQVLSSLLECWKSRDALVSHCAIDEYALSQFMCHALAYSFVNGLSALVDQSSLKGLCDFIEEMFATCPFCPVIPPCPIMDCYFDGKHGCLVAWNETKFSSQMPATSNMIISKEIQQTYHLADLLLASKCNILFVGEPGAGKSSSIKYLLSSQHQVLKLQMSRAMEINSFQDILRAKTKHWLKRQSQRGKLKSAKRVSEEKMVLFIDDVNLVVAKEDSPDQPVMECIRQMICEGGIYDFDGKYFHHLPPVQLLISYTSPDTDFVGRSRGNSTMNQRVRRHFNLISLRRKSEKEMVTFFSAHTSWMEGFDWLSMKAKFAKIIACASVKVHETVSNKFPAATNPLHVFSMNDLSKVFKGLSMVSTNGSKKFGTPMNSGNDVVAGNDGLVVGGTIDGKDFVESSVSDYISQVISQVQIADESKSFVEEKLKEVTTWWYHVTNQVYNNRYVCEEDSNWFEGFLMAEVEQLSRKMDVLAKELTKLEGTKESSEDAKDVTIDSEDLKSHFLAPFLNRSSYKLIGREAFKNTLYDVMEKHNQSNSLERMNLIFFDDMLSHTERLCRVLNIPSGHALLISQSGHGCRQIVKLVAKLMDAQHFEIISSWEHTDHKLVIKDACNMAGLKGKPVVISASEGLPESTLVYLSALICDGLCPGLYTQNELSLICNQLLPSSHRVRTNNDGYGQMEDRFFQRIRQNLHVVVCLNDDAELCLTLQKFPMLIHKVNCVDVYKEWTENILIQVVHELVKDKSNDFNQFLAPMGLEFADWLKMISKVMARIHIHVRDYIKVKVGTKAVAQPQKFIEFVQLFLNICCQRIRCIQAEIGVLEKATRKIKEVEEVIADIVTKIETLSPLLFEAKRNVNEANDEMKKCQDEYISMRSECEAQKHTIEEVKVPYEKLKKETDEEFNKLSPQYDAAVCSLKLLTQDAIDELRSYDAPPEGVIFVCDMLCVMFGVPEGWQDAKLLLMREKFYESLMGYNKDGIEKHVFQKLSRFVTKPSSLPENVREFSHAAYQLSVWLHAIHSYGCILRELKPKREASSGAHQKILEAERILVVKNEKLSHVTDTLETKILDYKEKLRKSKALEKQDQAFRLSLKHAQDLLKTSHVFSSVWAQKITRGEESVKASFGDSILTSALIVYGGVLVDEQREEVLGDWKRVFRNDEENKLTFSDDFALGNVVSNEAEIEKWTKKQQGGHGDSLIEKALKVRTLTTSGCQCWPFLVDPLGVSKTLVCMIEEGLKVKDYSTYSRGSCSKEDDKGYDSRENDDTDDGESLIILDADTPALHTVMERCMEGGGAVLLQHIERVKDTSLFVPLLEVRSGGGYFKTRAGGAVKKCHHKFRLYLSACTSMNCLQEEKYKLIHQRTIAFNLELDTQTLHMNILEKVIDAERADLIVNRERNKLDLLYLKQEQKKVHHNVFERVKRLAKNLVNDDSISDFIGFHQEQLMLLEEKIFDCARSNEDITKQMNEYQPLSTYLSRIYCIIQKIVHMNPLYHFSLQTFLTLLEQTLVENAMTKVSISDIRARIEEGKGLFTENVFKRLSITFFKEHAVQFPLHVVLENMKLHHNLNEKEMELFVLGFHDEENIDCFHDEKPEWIEISKWKRFRELSNTVPCFSDLLSILSQNGLMWQEYFKLEAMAPLPPHIMDDTKINDFQLGLLWLAYDDTLTATICKHFIIRDVGPFFNEIPRVNFHEACTLSCNKHVISVVLLPDDDQPVIIDPLLVITELSRQQGIHDVFVVSMNGEEELEEAITVVDTAVKQKSWVVLQNCHLVNDWKQCFINSVENIHNELHRNIPGFSNTHGNKFHLWMVLRSGSGVKLPAFIIENSFSIAWQSGANDVDDTESFLSGYKEEQIENEAILLDLFQEEVTKNGFQRYTEQYDITVRDLYFSKSLAKVLESEANGVDIHRAVKEIVYLPRLYTKYDCDVLWTSRQMKISRTHKCSDYDRRSLRYTCDTNIEAIQKPAKCCCDIRCITYLLERFQTLGSHHSKSFKVGTTGNLGSTEKLGAMTTTDKCLMTSCINEDIRVIQKTVKRIIYHLFLLKKILENKICRTKITEQIYNDLSSNVFPSVWMITWITDKIQDGGHFNKYVDTIENVFEYLRSIHSVSGGVHVPLDLSRLRNPKKVLNCVMLQDAMKCGNDVEEVEWVAEVVSTAPRTYPETGVLIENIKLINAKLDGPQTIISHTDTRGCSTTIPMVHFKPRLPSDNHDDGQYVDLPVYSRGRREILFYVTLRTSTGNVYKDVYMLV